MQKATCTANRKKIAQGMEMTVEGHGHRISRRSFLGNASLLPMAALSSLQAIAQAKPVVRSGGSMLKVSLNAFSFSKLLNLKMKHGKEGVDLFDLVEFCAKQNIDGMDATGYFFPDFPQVPADSYIFDLKRKAFEAGVGISGTGTRNNFTVSDKEKRVADVKSIKEWVVVASKLGAPVLRVFADTQMRAMTWQDVAKGFTQDQVREWIAEDLRECTEVGKANGVIIGVQNHGDFIRTSDDLLKLVGMVDSPWCGAIVDTGYFKTADPYKDMEKAAPYAVNWQVKESCFGAASDVPIDLTRLLKIVRASGYSGYLPVETLSVSGKDYDPYKVVPPFMQKLKDAIAKRA
jgi:sugar phosphate isomerase/epimerase